MANPGSSSTQPAYVSRTPDAHGHVHYSDEENGTWSILFERQLPMLEGRVCREYIDALEALQLPRERIPQLGEVSGKLKQCTGWSVAPVPALIDFTRFFRLLANRQFPSATFIRRREDLDYLQEPDIFHELFGHTPLLGDPRFAAFTEAYGRAGLAADPRDHGMLARLYWFTVEFGLIQTATGLRSFGAGIVSSPGELLHALDSEVPARKPFDVLEVLRTPYRIDIYQTVYFVISDFEELFELTQRDLSPLVREARRLGMHAPTFPMKNIA